MTYAVEERRGFVQLTGEIGTGKTMMLDALVLGLDARTKVARLSHTTISEEELFELMVSELGLDPRGGRKLERVAQIQEFLDEWTAAGRNSVLVVDEAQNLSLPVLEEIRLLSNLRSQGQCSLQIVLAGQPEFRTKLDREDLRQLKQRIGIRYHLTPLSERETGEYIAHRLSVAGANGFTIFDKGAVEAVFAYAGGVPRMINIVCDRALVAGYGANRQRIGKALILETVEEIEGAELVSAQVVALDDVTSWRVTGEERESPSSDAHAEVRVEADSAGIMSADLVSTRAPARATRRPLDAAARATSRTRVSSARPGVVGASVGGSSVPAWTLPAVVVVAALAVVAFSGVRTQWWRSLPGLKDDRASSRVRQERPDEFVGGSGAEVEADVGGEAMLDIGGTEPALVEPETGDSAQERPLTSGPGGPYRAVALSSRVADAASAEAFRLIERGISAEVIPADIGDGGVWYRVVVGGGYPALESAREVVDELIRMGYDGAWVHRE
ncbi:MAG: AAA family ATPase [Candidatus Eisenbacteria bacterium]